MKKTFSFIAAAAVILAAASCAKEMPVNQEKATSFQESTFSATIERPADSKAIIEDDGVFKFSEGDYILVFNNNIYSASEKLTENNINNAKFVKVEGKYLAYDATETDRVIAEKIPVTASMLTSGGLGITFSTVIGDKASSGNTRANCYHFYYISAGAFPEWSYVNCRSDDNANYICAYFYRKQSGNYTAATRKIMCYARSDEKSGQLKFYHIDSQFKFKVSDTNYDKVTFEANGTVGADNSINPDVTFYHGRVLDYTKEYSGNGNLSYNPNKITSATHPYWDKGAYTYTHNSSAGQSSIATVTLSGDASSVYYVAMPALYTYASGITIKLYKSGEVIKTLVAGQSITTAAAGIINFGDLAKVKKDTYTSYYEKYNDGCDIKFGTVTLNKSAYSNVPVFRVTESTTLTNLKAIDGKTAWAGYGIVFIGEGCTLTWDKTNYVLSGGETAANRIAMFIGDKVGTRSDIVVNKQISYRAQELVGFANLNIDNTATNSNDQMLLLNKDPNKTAAECCVKKLLANNCKFVTSKKISHDNYEGTVPLNFDIQDCDFPLAGDYALFYVSTDADLTNGESVIIKNNIFYSNDGTVRKGYVIHLLPKTAQTYQTVDIENNTYVHCTIHTLSSAYGAAENIVQSSMTIKNNLARLGGDGTALNYGKVVSQLSTSLPTSCSVSDNYGYVTNSANINRYQVYDNKNFTLCTVDPIPSPDFANGVFTKVAAYEKYGAQR